MGGTITAASGRAEEVQTLVAKTDDHIGIGDAFAVKAGDDIGLLGRNMDDLRRGAAGDLGEGIIFSLGIWPDKLDKHGTADLFDHQGVQYAVIHAGLGNGHEAAAVVTAVADGNQRVIVLYRLAIQFHRPMGGDTLEEKIDQKCGHIAALAVQ